MRLPNWLRLSREPDEVIGRHRMRRWWIFRTRWLALYLHHSTQDDERLLHDHPAWNVSLRLAGHIVEEVPIVGGEVEVRLKASVHCRRLDRPWLIRALVPVRGPGDRYMAFVDGQPLVYRRLMPRLVCRRATDIHRLTIPGRGCWTLWLRGPSTAGDDWGFYTPGDGWLPWRDGIAYMDAEDLELANASHG